MNCKYFTSRYLYYVVLMFSTLALYLYNIVDLSPYFDLTTLANSVFLMQSCFLMYLLTCKASLPTRFFRVSHNLSKFPPKSYKIPHCNKTAAYLDKVPPGANFYNALPPLVSQIFTSKKKKQILQAYF